MVTDPCKSLATNLVNLEILLQSTRKSDYRLTFIWSLVSFHMPDFRPLAGWPIRLAIDIFEFDFTQSNQHEFRLRPFPIEPPRPSTCSRFLRLRLSIDPPRIDLHYKEYNNLIFSHSLFYLMKSRDSWTLVKKPRETMPIASLHQENFTTLTKLVKESAMFCNVSTFSNKTLFLSTMSLTKWYCTSICLVLEW